MKNEINRIAGRLVKAFNTNTVINPIPVKYCKNINLANKLRKLCEDQIKDEKNTLTEKEIYLLQQLAKKK